MTANRPTATLIPTLFMALLAIQSCTSVSGVTTYRFASYELEQGTTATQIRADVEINLKRISLSDMYDYPQLFSFDVKEFPKYGPVLARRYKRGPMGRSWEFPFDNSQVLFLVRIRNETKHILRMRDARIYLIMEGREPIRALASAEQLLSIGFQGDLEGWSREFLFSRRGAYKLINDFGAELLPGFTYSGMLVFPVPADPQRTARVSFFDITTRTDAAGNPVEKTQFDFLLKPRMAQIWFDSNAMMFKSGAPPAVQ